jgi:hypothetical protein
VRVIEGPQWFNNFNAAIADKCHELQLKLEVHKHAAQLVQERIDQLTLNYACAEGRKLYSGLTSNSEPNT